MRRGRSRDGGMYFVTFSVFGSTLPMVPVLFISVNQTVPCLSRRCRRPIGTSLMWVNFSVFGSKRVSPPVDQIEPSGCTRMVCLRQSS